MLSFEIELNNNKCSAAKSGLKNGDLIFKINNIEVPKEKSPEEARQIVDDLIADAENSDRFDVLFSQNGRNYNVTLDAQDHGMSISIIKLEPQIKESETPIGKEENTSLKTDAALEAEFRKSNKNKVVNIYNCEFMKFITIAYSPKVFGITEIKSQLLMLGLSDNVKFLIEHPETKFDECFKSLPSKHIDSGLELSQNKMISKGYSELNTDKPDSSNEASFLPVIFYIISAFMLISGLLSFIMFDGPLAIAGALSGVVTMFLYIWLGSVINYLDKFDIKLNRKTQNK